jgi:hypothetical protein
MPLNLKTNDGDFSPYLKYNAKAGRFYARPEGGGDEIEVAMPRLAFDMANIKTGWIFYDEGTGPEKVWDPSNLIEAPRPAGPKKFKRGFEVMVYGPDAVNGLGKLGLREFSSTAMNCIGSILSMYDQYERDAAANPGKVPVFKCEGVRPVSGKFGTNYEPIFALQSWVERSKIPDFGDEVRAPVTPAYTEANPPPAQSTGEFISDEIPF